MKKLYTVKTNHDGIIGVYSTFKKALQKACISGNIEFTNSFYLKSLKRKYWLDIDNDEENLYISIQEFCLNK